VRAPSFRVNQAATIDVPCVLHTEVHPLTGFVGQWMVVPESTEQTGPVTQSRYRAAVLEWVVRRSLHRFFGLQELENALADRWRQTNVRYRSFLDSPATRLRLVWAMHGLLMERIYVPDIEPVFAEVLAAGSSAGLTGLHRGLRQRLRDRLPGPRSPDRLFRLPPAIAETIEAAGAGTTPMASDRVLGVAARHRHEERSIRLALLRCGIAERAGPDGWSG
jgi:hypothetical protein